jgi:hypothetical protein
MSGTPCPLIVPWCPPLRSGNRGRQNRYDKQQYKRHPAFSQIAPRFRIQRLISPIENLLRCIAQYASCRKSTIRLLSKHECLTVLYDLLNDPDASVIEVGGKFANFPQVSGLIPTKFLRVPSNAREILWQTDIGSTWAVWLRVGSTRNARVTFSYSLDGKHWQTAKAEVSLAGLPAWDQGLRVGLVSKGAKRYVCEFRSFLARPFLAQPSLAQREELVY